MKSDMAILRLFQEELKKEIVFEKESSPLLSELLFAHHPGIAHPCGGRGICKKCTVRIHDDAGTREVLSCQYRLTGDCDVYLPGQEETWVIEGTDVGSGPVGDPASSDSGPAGPSGCSTARASGPGPSSRSLSFSGRSLSTSSRLGAAVDIGTTTVVLNLYDLTRGTLLSSASAPNPQRSIAADVMGRIQAAMEGKLGDMQQMITDTLYRLLTDALDQAGIFCEDLSAAGLTGGNGRFFPDLITSSVITGNTTMLCLLTGTDPSSMAKAPFLMTDSFGKEWKRVWLPGCMHAFVGADITCAVLASGITEEAGTVLLADIGTNGELVLQKEGKLFVTSTAAGPAFEGAGIRCGCGSIEGAIDHVQVCGGQPVIHTIGGKKAVGLCGSGLIDAAAAGLSLGFISETGAMENPFVLSDGVCLYPEDVRSLQLAKAAVCAGIRTLLEVSGTSFEDVKRLYIAGGFGSHLNIEAAGLIGLIPEELAGKALPLGNAALAGASLLLMHPERKTDEKRITARSEHVNLGGNPLFNDYYMECMLFGEE